MFELKTARHHVIPWNILRDAWNKSLKLYETLSPKTAINDTVHGQIFKVMTEKVFKSQPNEEDLANLNDGVCEQVCWSKRNLVVGPLGDTRLFDPGERIDFEYPSAMGVDACKRILYLIELGKLLQKFIDFGPTSLWKIEFECVVKALVEDKTEIYKFDKAAWKLFSRPTIIWRTNEQGVIVGEASRRDAYWYRAGVPGDCVKKLYPEGIYSRKKGKVVQTEIKKYGNYINDINDARKTSIDEPLEVSMTEVNTELAKARANYSTTVEKSTNRDLENR